MMIVFAGAVTFMPCCMSFNGLYLQVLTEEEFPEKQHGDKYMYYKSMTGRLLPRFPG